MTEQTPDKNWLGLSEAAHFLGVHPVTLRRWADAGEISYMLTAGGHRRFTLTEIKRFAAERQHATATPHNEQVWADQAMMRAHQVIDTHRHAQWMEAYGDQDRERSRTLGRRLMAIVLQYVSSNENCDILFDEARAIGAQYALSAIEHGLAVSTALEATMSFRDAMFEAAILVPEVAHTSPRSNGRLLKRINTLINAVQLSVADAYDRASRR
jgi:excisionase family DNA binding protein